MYGTYNEEASHFFKRDHISKTATFVTAELQSDHEQWKGVTVRVIAGKKLHRKVSHARIIFEPTLSSGEKEIIFHIGGVAGINFPAILFRGFENITVKCPNGEVEKIVSYVLEPGDEGSVFHMCRLGGKFKNAYENVIEDICGKRNEFSASFDFILNSWKLWDPWTEKHDF